jgi:sRNA-binding carbon storage regulator CsrA
MLETGFLLYTISHVLAVPKENAVLLLTRYVKQGLVIDDSIFIEVISAENGVVTFHMECPETTKVRMNNVAHTAKRNTPEQPPRQTN